MRAFRHRFGPGFLSVSPQTLEAESTQSTKQTPQEHSLLATTAASQRTRTLIADLLKADDLLRLRFILENLNIPTFNLSEKFGIKRGQKFVPYLLGTGVSCTVVQHETDDSTSEAVEPGTVVALKRYTYDASVNDLAADKQLAEVILQDLRVFCHPRLRNHEHFCRLLYIAWEPYSLLPAFALELASFGTLHDALESEFQMSWLQKCHVSLDITLGLGHLHDCGLVHGDIKATNILLQEHKSRQVVAKLMDFSGVTDAVNYGRATHPQFVSRMWLPPEILLTQSNIDYKKVDVYAYGILMTQMWCNVDFGVYETYLETLVPEFFTVGEKQMLILYFKSCSKHDTDSLLNQSRTFIATSSDYAQAQKSGFPLDLVQEMTLVPNPNERSGFCRITHQFFEFAQAHNRQIPACLDTTEIQHEEEAFWKHADSSYYFVFNDIFSGVSHEHKRLVLQYMIKVTEPFESVDDLLIPGTESDYRDKDRLLYLMYRNRKAKKARLPKQKYRSNLYFQIAMCYFMGLGTKINEIEGLKYLAMAAKSFAERAMSMYTSVEASIHTSLSSNMPHRLLLSDAYLRDSTETIELLKAFDPSLLSLLTTIRCERGVSLHRTICRGFADIREDNWTTAHAGSNDIFSLIESENVCGVQQLLHHDASVASSTKYGLSTLHALSLISDEVASQMVTALLTAGASLDAMSYESLSPFKNRMGLGYGAPLTWAIVKQKPKLFASLIEWCIQHDIIPNVGKRVLGFLPFWYIQFEMAQYLMDAQKTMIQASPTRAREFFWPVILENIPESHQSHFDPICPTDVAQHLQGCSWSDLRRLQIQTSLASNDNDTILRRWMLGGDYQRNRLKIANLVAPWVIEFAHVPDIAKNPVSCAIVTGDGISLLAFILSLEQNNHDCDQLFGRNGILNGADSQHLNWTVLHGTLSAPSMEAFTMLLPRFRHFIPMSSHDGLTPLIQACVQGHIGTVRKLLEYNANVLHRANSGANAIVFALGRNQLLIAELLLTKCDVLTALGPNQKGLTGFGQLLGTYLSGRRQIQIPMFDFFRRHSALSFITNGKDNVWRRIFLNSHASLDEHRTADLHLLRYFLRSDVFGKHINDLDWTGRTALHYAAMYNHFEALEMLLDHEAPVNTESVPLDEQSQHSGGLTAVDYALEVKDAGPPKYVLAGGAREVKLWQIRITATIKLLVDRGAKAGRGAANSHEMELHNIREPHSILKFHILNLSYPDRGIVTWRGKWPKRIPSCPSQETCAAHQPSPWRDDDLEDSPDGSETQFSQVEDLLAKEILCRTPQGGKPRKVPLITSFLESVLSVPGNCALSEEDKRKGYDLLQRARTFIAARQLE